MGDSHAQVSWWFAERQAGSRARGIQARWADGGRGPIIRGVAPPCPCSRGPSSSCRCRSRCARWWGRQAALGICAGPRAGCSAQCAAAGGAHGMCSVGRGVRSGSASCGALRAAGELRALPATNANTQHHRHHSQLSGVDEVEACSRV